MIRTFQFHDRDVPVYLCECTTPEEVQAAGLPPGLTHYWERAGEKILSSLSVMAMIQENVLSARSPVSQILDRTNMRKHAETVIANQRQAILDTFEQARQQYATDPTLSEEVRAELLKNMDSTIRAYKRVRHFDVEDGHGLRYDPEIARDLGYGDLPYTPPQQPVTL